MPSTQGAVTGQTESSADIATRVHEARIFLVLSRTVAPIAVGMPFACLMVWVVWPSFEHAALLGWLGLKLLTASGRIVERILRRRHPPGTPVSRIERVFLPLLAVDGFVWGAPIVIFPTPEELAGSAILYACIVGVAAIGATSLGAWFKANATFVIAILLPGAVNGVLAGNAPELFAAIGVTLFLGLLLHDGRLAGLATEELLRRRFDMDRLAAERAEALALAEHHSAVKSRFLATMSHEMRTPLHGMLGTLQLLRDEAPPTMAERLDVVGRSGEHLLGIINDVLDFSKIEAGRMVTETAPFEIGTLLREAIELFSHTARLKGLRLSLDSQLPATAWISGDAARIRQILMNLLGNALKFTEQGSVEVTARRDGDRLRLAVKDTGIGIATNEQQAIFDAFRQVEDGDTRRYSGTGLGLTISRELARAMGGDLGCASAPGAGSVFTLDLPWLPAAAAAVAAESAPRVSARAGLVGKVLLVDDNPVNLMVAEAMLEKFGADISVASNGEEAVAVFATVRPAVVLMDCHMPVLDGYAATGRIRELEAREGLPRTPIIAVTANAFDDDRARCLDAGMDEHLAKPFREEALQALLQRYMGRP